MNPKTRAGISLSVCLLGLTTGCQTWHSVETTPRALISQERPSKVRVTSADGSSVTFSNPVIAGDTILPGTTAPTPGFGATGRFVLMDDVRTVEVSEFSAPRTIALAAGIVAASVAWASVAGETSSGTPPPNQPVPKSITIRVSDGLRALLGGWLR